MIKNELAILYNTLYLNGFVKDNNGTNSTLIKNAIEIIDKLQKENDNKDKVIDLMAEHLFNVGKLPYRTNIFTKEELIQKYYEEVGDIE